MPFWRNKGDVHIKELYEFNETGQMNRLMICKSIIVSG